MLTAQNKQATRANTTASGSEPAANATPAGMDAAIAAPGAMSVMDWNRTSRSPMAFRRRPRVWLVVVSLTAMTTSPGRGAWSCRDRLTAQRRRTGPSQRGLLAGQPGRVPDVTGYVGVRGEPHAVVPGDVVDQFLQHHEPGPRPDHVRVHGQLEQPALRVGLVKLVAPHLADVPGRGERAGRVGREVRRVVPDPLHRDLHDPGGLAGRLDLVRVVVGHQR